MYKFEVMHSVGRPEAQIQTDSVFLEIVNFLPQDVYNCFPHHVLLAWLSPLPVMGRGYVGASGSTPRLCDLGNLAFVPASVPAHTRFQSDTALRRSIVLRLAPDIFERLLQDESQGCDPWAMASLDIRAPDIQRAARQLAEEVMNPGMASALMVESLATSMLVNLVRSNGQRRQANTRHGGLAPWQLRRITEHLADDCVSIPSLVELAALAGISPSHLRCAFKASTGSTIGEYTRNVRFERASALLSTTDLTLKEVATRLGYTSYYGFSTAFQRSVGESPLTFRQRTQVRRKGRAISS